MQIERPMLVNKNIMSTFELLMVQLSCNSTNPNSSNNKIGERYSDCNDI